MGFQKGMQYTRKDEGDKKNHLRTMKKNYLFKFLFLFRHQRFNAFCIYQWRETIMRVLSRHFVCFCQPKLNSIVQNMFLVLVQLDRR